MTRSAAPMAGYLDLAHRLARRIADGDPPPGGSLPGVRAIAAAEGTGTGTAARALEHLARAGVLSTAPRRVARVLPDGPALARALVSPVRPLVLAAGDDPALGLLLAACAETVERLPSEGSSAGLVALRDGRADAAALDLWHASGEWNAPYVRVALAGRPGRLVHLWERSQGIVLPRGNPGVRRIGDLRGRVVARRPAGTGTRALEARLLRDAGLPVDALSGPELAGHLEIGIAVASGAADAGLGLRAAADGLGLAFVELAREPMELALAEADRPRAAALLTALADPSLRRAIEALGGYHLARAGDERDA